MFQIEATKTYEEKIAEDSNIELSLSVMGYNSATVQALRDWFGTRIVCDDNKFSRFYLRLARAYVNKYNADLRVESIDKNFDPLVENYFEHYTEYDGVDQRTPAQIREEYSPEKTTITHTPAEITRTTKDGKIKELITPAEVTNETTYGHTSTRNGSMTSEQSGSSFDETNSDADTKGLLKANPMSSSSVSTGSGDAASNEILGLDWSHSSQQDQQTSKGYNKVVHDLSGKPTTTDTYDDLEDKEGGKDSSSVTVQEPEERTREQLTNGTDVLTVDKPETTIKETDVAGYKVISAESSEQMSYGKEIKERSTGRAGLTPQEALSKAFDYLRTYSPAFMELKDKLEPAFLGVYDI